ncbi:DNA polymerase III subunit beta [Prosthecobacter vanneervenii]|uniref:Beta sliding clamp n=1 Tax=Prosthecobacter vanneervenii TaxID=48466 RepID=A0A7W7Y777_9BACT|nr:DNA polymerase III subunit beta [Prosthecobacter vanneervenii]MBB5030525.1 DNA polymerase III sliding clamp (beta) subunit (PCNA family) [Prosthecobacter vanneervenii]
MKPITLPIAELKPALAGLGKIINAKATLPVLGTIKVERTADGWIALTSTDLDRWATVRFEHPTEGPPSMVLLPFDQLSQLVKSCGKGEALEVSSSQEASVIRFPLGESKGESRVPFIQPGEFPLVPKMKNEAIPLPTGLRDSILEAMECASTDQTRHVLNGTFIDARDPKAHYIVASNGRQLYSANSFTLPLKESVIIPAHKFLEWKEFRSDGEWQIRVGEQHLQVCTRRWRFITKTIEGNYPDWKAPIPNPAETKTVLTLDPAKLDALIKLIQRMPCHEDRYHTLGLAWEDDQLVLLGRDKPEDTWLRVPVPDTKGTGPEMTIFLDRHHMQTALSFGLNVISLIDPSSPLRFSSGGKQLIAVPVRLETPPVSTPTPTAPKKQDQQTPPSPAEQPTSPPMQTSTNGSHSPAPASNNTAPSPTNAGEKQETKSPLEAALLQIESIKTGFRESINGLTKVGDQIRQAMREQKASEKEIQGVRQTLRSLQSVRI